MRIGTFRALALIVLVGGLAGVSQAAEANGDIDVIGKLIDVRPQPGCGVFFIGSPATYRVINGPASLDGKQITAVVPCIEMPLIKGDVRKFVVGDVHYLRISRKNPYRGLSTDLQDQSWFYLQSAWFHEPQSNSK